jgi:Peroxisomal biogenesis factor 11 (PEX11)
MKVWFDTTGIMKCDAKLVTSRACKSWLFAMASSLAANLYKLRWNAIRRKQEERVKGLKSKLDDSDAILKTLAA